MDGFDMNEKIPIPDTSHDGIREHFIRACLFFNSGMQTPDFANRFRILIAAVYSCRAIVELMLEQADRSELTVDRDTLKETLAEKLPRYGLIERIRIHDFHRYGLVPPNPKVKMMATRGPITLKASKGAAVLQQTMAGPKITCTGNSSVKLRRALFSVDGTFYDEDTDSQVELGQLIKDYLVALPDAVAEFETLCAT